MTKALTAIAPDHPELAAARAAGIPLEPWQQVVADAAVGRTLIGVAGTHGKTTTAGWLVHVLVGGRPDPVGVRRRAAAGGADRRRRRRRRAGGGRRRSSSRRTSTPATSTPYRPAVAVVTSRRVGPPGRVRRPGRRRRRVRGWLRRAAAATDAEPPTLVANVADAGVAELVATARATGRAASSRRPSSTPPPARRRLRRGMAEQYATAAGPAAALLGRIVAAAPDGTTSRSSASIRFAAPVPVRAATAGRHNAANALGVAAAAAVARRRAVGRSPRGLATFRGVGRRLERKGEAARRRGVRRLRPSPDGDPRDARGRPPARARAVGSGRSTSR